eukprot:3940340-Rhodomonas_salina.2
MLPLLTALVSLASCNNQTSTVNGGLPDNIAQKQLIAQLFGLKTHFELVSFPRNRAVWKHESVSGPDKLSRAQSEEGIGTRVHMAKPCWRPFSATERLFDLGGERRFLSLG